MSRIFGSRLHLGERVRYVLYLSPDANGLLCWLTKPETQTCVAIWCLKDYKCVIGLADESSQFTTLPFHVFRPEADMPTLSGGDVVVVFNAKVGPSPNDTNNW